MANEKSKKLTPAEALAVVDKLATKAAMFAEAARKSGKAINFERHEREAQALRMAHGALRHAKLPEVDASKHPTAGKLLSSHEAAKLCQSDPSSVVKWINDGKLPSYRTPGGHRRVAQGELVDFMRAHGMRVPPELIEPTADEKH